MDHIGNLIRKKRQEKKLSAEFIATHLKQPITKQAFAKKERTGHFSYSLVIEVAAILACEMSELQQ